MHHSDVFFVARSWIHWWCDDSGKVGTERSRQAFGAVTMIQAVFMIV
jgi:hypothetical protein